MNNLITLIGGGLLFYWLYEQGVFSNMFSSSGGTSPSITPTVAPTVTNTTAVTTPTPGTTAVTNTNSPTLYTNVQIDDSGNGLALTSAGGNIAEYPFTAGCAQNAVNGQNGANWCPNQLWNFNSDGSITSAHVLNGALDVVGGQVAVTFYSSMNPTPTQIWYEDGKGGIINKSSGVKLVFNGNSSWNIN